MDEGHILDHRHTQTTYSHWQPGPVTPEKIFGWKLPESAQIDRENWRAIVSYCCPECGLLREYALKQE